MTPPARQSFHRDAALPFAEVRDVRAALDVCYARHSHEGFSVGAVTGGSSLYLHERGQETVGPGTVVMMNPQAMHACNPRDGERWSYRMIHLDAAWMAGVQRELGVLSDAESAACDLAALTSDDRALFDTVLGMSDAFANDAAGTLAREESALLLVGALHARLRASRMPAREAARPQALARVAEHLRDRCAEPVSLAELCGASGLSASYLVRAFKSHYGMTPHAYLLNHRIQRGRAALRRGRAIADVAAELGFADQAHLQRTFKRYVAATPGQYRARG